MKQTIRVPAWRVAIGVVFAAILIWIFVSSSEKEPRRLIAGGLLVLAAVGLLETMVLRIVIDDDKIVVHRLFRRTTYGRGDVAGVETEEGHVILLLISGRRVLLPSVNRAGETRHQIASWLKATR